MLLKIFSIISFNLLSTVSNVQRLLLAFCAISKPDTDTPPALAALPGI
nr:hypothetical protein [Alteracholeplasma palmae]